MAGETGQDRQETRSSVEGFNAARKGGRSSDTTNAGTKRRTVPGRGRTGTVTAEEKTKVDDKRVLAINPADGDKNKETDVKLYEPNHAAVPAPKQGQPKNVELNVTEPNPVDQKKATPSQTKKRTTRKKKPAVDMSQFDAILIGFSDYVSARPNMAHWKMTEKEVQSITEPLGNIIAKSDLAGQMAEHSDAIALVLACGMVFIPRITISAQISKQKKEAKKTGFNLKSEKEVKKDESVRSEKTEDGKASGGDGRKRDHSNHVPTIHSDLSDLGSGLPVF